MIDNEEESFELIEKYRVIIENVNDLICIIDQDHPYKIKFINETIFLSLLNYSNEDIVDKSILNYIHPEDFKDFEKFLKKGTDGKVNFQEIRVKHKNNKYIWFEYKIKKYKDSNNNKKLLLILKNRSQNKTLEEKISESEAKLKNLMTSLPEIRFWKLFYPKKYEEALRTSYEMLQKVIDNIPENIFWKDTNLVYLGCNQNYSNFIGAGNPEYVIGETNKELLLEDLLPIEKILKLEEKETKVIKLNQPEFHVVEYWVLKNGEKLWFDTNRIPLHDSEGNVAGILVTYDDITELKKAEEELRESEEKFRTISERSLLGFFILQDDVPTYVNRVASISLGYPINEMKEWKPEKYLQLFFPEDRDLIATLATQLQRGLRPKRTNIQVRCIKKSKKIMWVELFGQSINFRGRPAGLISAIDITQRKKAEEDLIESEEKYRHLFGNSPNMICLIDINRKIIDLNAALLKFFKFEKKQMIGKDFLKVYNFSKENLSLIDTKYKELLKKGNIKPFEIEFIFENDKSVWVNVQASFVETGIKTLIEVLMQDITERKLSEEILQLNEARLEALLKLSQMGDLSEKEIADFATVKSVDLTKSKLSCIFFLNEDESTLKVVSCSNQIEDHCNIKKNQEFSSKEINLWNEILIQRKPIVNNNCKNNTNLFTCVSCAGERVFRYLCIPILEGEHIVAVTAVINKKSNYNESDIHQLTLFMDGVWKSIQRKRARDALEKSEGKYRDLLETSSMGILEYDFNINDYSYVNPKLLSMLGYDKNDNFNIKNFSGSIHPDDLKKFNSVINKEKLEFRIYDKDGNLKWFLGKLINQFDEDGNYISFRVWLEDITEKKMYEELIYELNINFLNFTTDIQRNIEMLIETCGKLLSASAVLLVHKRIQDGKEVYQLMDSNKEVSLYNSEEFNKKFFISELFEENHDYIQTLFDIHETEYSKIDPYIAKYDVTGCYGKLIKSQDEYNSAICVFYKKNPIISHQDKLVLFLICDAIEIEQRRWKVQQDLEEQSNLKSELLSRTSHELKTPLISIKGFTELLLTVHKTNLDTDMISILEEIKEGSSRLEKLVNSLLESSRLDQGQLKLNITTEDLTFLIKFCVKELQGLAELRNQTITLNVQEYLTCNFDKERAYEVMSNLLLNAIKYTPPGGEIVIRSKIKEKFYIISVEDTGIGITEEEKGQLFKQFGKIERYGKGWDVDIEGSGLGLYISKKIVELHGGKIWVESEGRNRGCRFYFSLPIISE